MPHAAVPAVRVPVARQEDQRVAGDPLLADGAGQLAQLGGVGEVARRLEKAEGPAWWHHGAAEQLCHLAHHAAHVATHEEVPGERAGLRGVDDAHPVVRAPDRDDRLAGVVPEERVAAIRHEERHPQIGAGPAPQVAVPELARHAESVEVAAALTEAVEVLLAREGQRGAEPAPAAGVGRLTGHAAVGGLANQPLAARIEESQAQRVGRDLDLERGRHEAWRLAAHDLEGRRCPLAIDHVGRRRSRGAGLERDPHDPRGQHGHRHLRAVSPQADDRSVALHSPPFAVATGRLLARCLSRGGRAFPGGRASVPSARGRREPGFARPRGQLWRRSSSASAARTAPC